MGYFYLIIIRFFGCIISGTNCIAGSSKFFKKSYFISLYDSLSYAGPVIVLILPLLIPGFDRRAAAKRNGPNWI